MSKTLIKALSDKRAALWDKAKAHLDAVERSGDALTGEARPGGATFEQYLGKALEPKFLLDVGAETLNFVIPGANLAKLMIVKGLELKAGK